ncbi:hypothetical protein [Acrocarpospora catenulata]|uniref:hypothetical protein n=1 Tax=Acrocarpospora catenulata TaxID=2836182 RepID=UPI001BDAB3B9|nr:hypothetical protein [Acrocarpospora catenulata]
MLNRRAQAMTDFVWTLAQRGDVERAAALAETISDPDYYGQAMNRVIKALTSSGDLLRAETLARTITDSNRDVVAMATLAEAVARHGDLNRAESLARSITNPDFKVDALTAVADHADHARASRIIAELLSAGEWLKPLPVIAKIAPAAVIAIADEILAS